MIKFKAGQFWKDKDGHRLIVLETSNKGVRVYNYVLDKTYYEADENLIELCAEPHRGEIWVNIYGYGKNGNGVTYSGSFSCLKVAERAAKSAENNYGDKLLARLYAEWIEGDGL